MLGQLIPYPLYTQIDLDSAALMMKCAIAHPLPKKGMYHGTIMLGKRFIGGFLLDVSQEADENQANIDLAELHQLGRGDASNEIAKRLRVKVGGYMVLHVSQGEGGYHVLLRNTSIRRASAWDSRSLKSDDIFSIKPLRPGVYSLSNTAGGQAVTTRLVVTYPDPRLNKLSQPRPEPIYANCYSQSFEPGGFEIRSAQAIILTAKAPARFLLTLQQADDGSEEIRQWHEQQQAELIRMIQQRRVTRTVK